MRPDPSLIVVVAAWTCAFLPRVQAQDIVGTHYSVQVETPWLYEGSATGQPIVLWHYELSHPSASYIAIHLTDFYLAEGDYLLVSDPDDQQSYSLRGQGKMNAGTFWAKHIKGDLLILDLVVTSPDGGQGFRIDEYVAGDPDIGDQAAARSVCTNDDRLNAVCFQQSHPAVYERARAVCRMLINGSSLCTGWLVSPNGHVMSNAHCLDTASAALNTDFDFMAEAPNCSTPNCFRCFPGVVFSGATLLDHDTNLDYVLLQVADGNPSNSFGFIELDNRQPDVGEQIYIPQHPGGRAKVIGLNSSVPDDDGGVCRIQSVTGNACIGGNHDEIEYFCDSQGGSSGSPVLSAETHRAIGLHHCGGANGTCPNTGVPINLIAPRVQEFLGPSRAGVIATDQTGYQCIDILTMILEDGDLVGQGIHEVILTASTGDSETVSAIETGPATGRFQGSISLFPAIVSAENGLLEVLDSAVIVVTYADQDDGHGNSVESQAEAVIDCRPPTISDVVTEIAGQTVNVTFNTNEPACARVRFGLSCNNLAKIADGQCGRVNHIINLSQIDPSTTHFFAVDATDEIGNHATDSNGGTCYSFTTPEFPDSFFSEQFTSNDNDLDHVSVTFVTDQTANHYSMCIESISELPTNPAGGINLQLLDDDFREMTLTRTISLYGRAANSIFVASNGFITFDVGDLAPVESLVAHFSRSRISGLFDDLNPAAGGAVLFRELEDRAVVTWHDVPEWLQSSSNTFQIEMFFDGVIRISWLEIAAADGLVGLSEGFGVPPNFSETDISSAEAGADCNANGVADACELIAGDCNANGVLDQCEFLECLGFLLGDLNCDDAVNGLDIQIMLDHLVTVEYFCPADMNQNGSLEDEDTRLFIVTLLE